VVCGRKGGKWETAEGIQFDEPPEDKAMLTVSLLLTLAASSAVLAQESNLAEELADVNVNDLCKDRPDNEYFRLTTEGDCKVVFRCDRAGRSGIIRLAQVKCPNR